MRILLATHWAMPDVGGVRVYLDQLRGRLTSEGHEVDLMSHHPDLTKYHLVGTGRTFHKSNVTPYVEAKIRSYYRRTFPELDDFCIDMEVKRYSFELAAAYFGLASYDVIHTQDVLSTMAMRRVKPASVPLIATIHGGIAREIVLSGLSGIDESVRWHYLSMLEYAGSTASDVTIVPSHWLKGMLSSEYGVPGDRLHVVPNGMDTGSFLRAAEQPTSQGRRWDRKVLICPARLVTIKGQHVLLDALAQLKTVRTDWECWLVGDGTNRADFEAQAGRLGLGDHVAFLGDRTDVPQLLRLADVFVMASLQDNLPYAVMEAQLAGKPCVVSNAGGIPEMVTAGETGLISDVGDVSGLAYNLRRLVEDDALRANMGEAAKQRALSLWSAERMTTDTKALYESALAMKRGVRR
ncbi:glycosyltransferase family 4 protein [Paenibacillus sp. TRM 82003]|nr:glycosyltransferase family 4 protein [Paenibacillus sp. TRM 82003]